MGLARIIVCINKEAAARLAMGIGGDRKGAGTEEGETGHGALEESSGVSLLEMEILFVFVWIPFL